MTGLAPFCIFLWAKNLPRSSGFDFPRECQIEISFSWASDLGAAHGVLGCLSEPVLSHFFGQFLSLFGSVEDFFGRSVYSERATKPFACSRFFVSVHFRSKMQVAQIVFWNTFWATFVAKKVADVFWQRGRFFLDLLWPWPSPESEFRPKVSRRRQEIWPPPVGIPQ